MTALPYARGSQTPAPAASAPAPDVTPSIGTLHKMLVDLHGYTQENNAYLAQSLTRANGPFAVSASGPDVSPPEGLIDALAAELDRLQTTLMAQRQMLDVLAARCT